MKQHSEFPNLFVADHPLIQHKLSLMRDVACHKAQFKLLLKEISLLMGYELTRHLPLTTRPIATPMCGMDAPVLAGKKPVIVPVLRAGLAVEATQRSGSLQFASPRTTSVSKAPVPTVTLKPKPKV